MRRATVIGLMGLTMILLSARPASAQWEWFKWIQELSGPGPFELHGATFTFGCRGDNNVALPSQDTVSPLQRGLFCDRIPRQWRAVDRFVGVTFAKGDGKNNLVYPSTAEPQERVSAWMVRLSATKRINEVADVGSGIGFLRFSGARDVFATKFYLNPFVAVRPLGFLVLTDSPDGVRDFFARSLDITVGAIIFPQGFRLSDFGATAGADLTGDPEVSFHAGIRVVVFF